MTENEEYHPKNYEHLPTRKRKCTDIICMIFWVLFWSLLISFSIYGFVKGDLNNIAQPYDSDGLPCGRGDAVDYPFLFVNDPFSKDYSKNMVCIKTCPRTKQDGVECVTNNDIKNCQDVKVYESVGFAGRVCIPKNPNLTNAVRKRVNLSKAQEIIEDIKDAWPVFIIVMIISIAFCFFFYCLLQSCAGPMIVFMLAGAICGLIGFGVFNWYEKRALENESVYNEDLADDYKNTAIVCWVVAGLLLIAVCCLASRIKVAVSMISAAADFITDVPLSLFIPIILTGVLAVFLIWWIISFSYLFSVGELRYDSGDLFGDMVWTTEVEVGVYLMGFGLLWFFSFLMSSNIFVISSLSASWYFERDTGNQISMLFAFKMAWFYHLGTLAFGSFLIALLWAITLILTYVYNKVKQETGKDSFMLKCMICFVACFERTLRFLNKHAYIEVVLRNNNFCGSVKKCISVMTDNFARFAILSGLVNLFLLFGTVLIAVGVSFLGHLILTLYGKWKNVEFESFGPLVIIFLIALVVSLLFNEIFEISSDTMLHCFILEESTPNKGKHASSKLSNIVNDINNKQYQPLKGDKNDDVERNAERDKNNRK